MASAFIRATVPDALLQEWLQHLRDFDAAHPGCHFEIGVDTPEMSVANMLKSVQVDPPFPVQGYFKRGGNC